MNITIYCGANTGNDPEFVKRASELGAWMAENGHTLIYGAGNAGMMGALSDAVIQGGGRAVGVTPEFFVINEETREDLSEVIIADDMPTRRGIMMEMGDAFIALPGGTGTLDEIAEVIAMNRLGRLGSVRKPVMLYNVNGYYDKFFGFLDDMAGQEFCTQRDRDNAIEVTCIGDIERALRGAGAEDHGRNKKYDS